MQGFFERRAEFVDGVVKAKVGIHIDVPLHRTGEGSKEIPIVGRRRLQILGMIEGVLAGGEVLGVMSSARMRTNGVNRAPAILQKRALDILRDVFKRRQWQHLFGMSRQPNQQRRHLARGEMAAEVVGDEEDLMGEDIDPEGAANAAAFTASQLDASLLDNPAVERVNKVERPLGRVSKFFRRERASDVFSEFLDRVFGHLWRSSTPCPRCASRLTSARGGDAGSMKPFPRREGRGRSDTRFLAQRTPGAGGVQIPLNRCGDIETGGF